MCSEPEFSSRAVNKALDSYSRRVSGGARHTTHVITSRLITYRPLKREQMWARGDAGRIHLPLQRKGHLSHSRPRDHETRSRRAHQLYTVTTTPKRWALDARTMDLVRDRHRTHAAA